MRAAGFIGKLTVKIPWAQLRSKAVIIEIQDLFIVLGPSCPEADAEAEEGAFQSAKEDALAALQAKESKVHRTDDPQCPHLSAILISTYDSGGAYPAHLPAETPSE